MYTYTPTHRFLVLSAADSVPFNPANKFLVLSPTESGPDPRVFEQAVADSPSTEESPNGVPKSHRSDSTSSTSSEDSTNGFLFLGHTGRRFSQ
ncbi:uncharacterized protein N7484_002861 [Penicillium longicatenatum]|uniref:uncharacterized protein n=1 Tax=Penicillium longicatenatum TaxID=1561947 RepID=UPI002546CB26|nr:uncharacterized protein N7484_002861 [Penicillium longicatenatum]KAJ5649138.1 hypothetical protein N7484_002861 [Penicillium longicatenatum]